MTDIPAGSPSETDPFQDYEIGLATPEDALGICKVRKEVWYDTYIHQDADPLRTVTREDLDGLDFLSDKYIDFYKTEALNTENQQILVARDKDEVVGVIVGRRKGDFNTFVTFFVLPEYQDKGIGGELLDRTLSWFGYDKPVKIDVVDFNERSIEMYKRHGFRVSSKPILHDSGKLPSGKMIYEVEMTKDSTS